MLPDRQFNPLPTFLPSFMKEDILKNIEKRKKEEEERERKFQNWFNQQTEDYKYAFRMLESD